MKNWLQRFGIYIFVIAIVLVGISIYFTTRGSSPALISQSKGFFIDEETGEESIRPLSEFPPLTGSAGKPTIVIAVKYSCDGGKTSKIAYLMKYTPEGKQALDSKANDKPFSFLAENTLVRSPAPGSQWFPQQSVEASQIVSAIACPEGQYESVVPK